jgi:serine/threonine protein kinase
MVLDRYRLRRRLGTGGFATVWLARDERLDRDVAVKILPRDRVLGGRFEREARAAARLSHPGIVTLFEAAVDDEGAYLVSELVHGATLDELLQAGRLSDRDVVRIGIALCDALGHAHAHGVIHRDVKPSNVLVPDAPATSAQLAKLTDFGVARVLGGDSLTRTGDVIGTAAYMAPEQAQGLPAGIPADLFSLALVLYEGLTGVNPVRAPGAQHARRLGAHLPPLRRQRRELPRELGRAIDLALRPRPGERGTLEELRRGLTDAAGQVEDEPGVVTGPWPARTEPFPRLEGATAPRDPPSGRGRSEEADEAEEAAGTRWTERAVAGVAAAGLGAWLAAHVAGASPAPAALTACVAGLLVAAAPRAGWALAAVVMAASLILHSHPGAALVVVVGALIPIVLCPRDGPAWPLTAAAPALGALGLAGAWPAAVALARTAWRRAALAAAGCLWLAILSRATPAVLSSSSLDPAANDVIRPLLTAGVIAPCLIWAAAAIVLPWIRIPRSPALEVVLLAGWAALLALLTVAASKVGGGEGLFSSGAAFAGAFAGALVTLVTRWSRRRLARAGRRTVQRDSRSMEPR